MAKIRGEAIQVRLEGKVPRSLCWRGQRIVAAVILDWWRDTGCWWEGEGEKVFFRIGTSTGGIYEIYREEETGEWYLYREYD